MVWKMLTPNYDIRPVYRPETHNTCEPEISRSQQQRSRPKPLQQGSLVALVGTPLEGKPSSRRDEEHLERICKINSELLGYNAGANMVLLRVPQNERSFDTYVSFPFMKGVTERRTGRTLLILGSKAHHGEAMQDQFSNVIWTPKMIEDTKSYGDTIRWISVGDIKNGFIGLDYNPRAKQDDGVATSIEDIRFLAQMLMEFGYNPEKRLFLLKPPYIVESEQGKRMRRERKESLHDFANI